jgi:hypothetical protein
LQASYATELKAQEAEAFSLCQVNLPTLFLVDIDLEFGQFLKTRRKPEAFRSLAPFRPRLPGGRELE